MIPCPRQLSVSKQGQFLWWGVVSTSTNSHVGGPPHVSCSLLLTQYMYVQYTADARLLARGWYPEGPATGHFGTGFSWFPCVYKQMLRWFPRLQVATVCFSCSPPGFKFLAPFSQLGKCTKLLPLGNSPIAVNKLLLLLLLLYSQLPSILEVVPPSETWGCAMPWWLGPTFVGNNTSSKMLHAEYTVQNTATI